MRSRDTLIKRSGCKWADTAADRGREGVWTVAFGVRLNTSTDTITREIGSSFEHKGYRLFIAALSLERCLNCHLYPTFYAKSDIIQERGGKNTSRGNRRQLKRPSLGPSRWAREHVCRHQSGSHRDWRIFHPLGSAVVANPACSAYEPKVIATKGGNTVKQGSESQPGPLLQRLDVISLLTFP